MSTASQKTFKKGDLIMQEGDPGSSAYIIEAGRVEISIQREGFKKQIIGTRGPGSMIGEMAIIDNAPRTATIIALEECTLFEITQDEFMVRLNSADPVISMTTQVILARYRDMLSRAKIIGDPPKPYSGDESDIATSGLDDAMESIKINSDFKEGLKNGEVSLYYQPVIDLQTRKIAGFEALMRWNQPERGFVPPDIFIPIIEDSGLIAEASKWALREAASGLRRLQDASGYDHELFMSINFSARDFTEDDFFDNVQTALKDNELEPHQLHLEITERLLMEQPDNAKKTLTQCREAGLYISIDDFGTGYSSLSYLHYFPISTLKIDRSFIMEMTKDSQALELVKTTINLGKSLYMKVIAEGIESAQEAEILTSFKCDMVQGFYFSKPVPEDELIPLVKDAKVFE